MTFDKWKEQKNNNHDDYLKFQNMLEKEIIHNKNNNIDIEILKVDIMKKLNL